MKPCKMFNRASVRAYFTYVASLINHYGKPFMVYNGVQLYKLKAKKV